MLAVNVDHFSLRLLSRATAFRSENHAHGMGFAKCISDGKRSREGSLRTKGNIAQKKPVVKLGDPSRESCISS